MAKQTIYIVHQLVVHNYEKQLERYYAYTNEQKALSVLQTIKGDYDMQPRAERELFCVMTDTPRKYDAGRQDFFDKHRSMVEIIEAQLIDAGIK